jgi:hypothetical protein
MKAPSLTPRIVAAITTPKCPLNFDSGKIGRGNAPRIIANAARIPLRGTRVPATQRQWDIARPGKI